MYMPRKTVKKTIHKKVHRTVKRAVVPHTGNQFRPLLVRRHGLAVILLLILSAFGLQNLVVTGSVLGQATDVTRQRLLETTNAARADAGAGALVINEDLNQAAQAKAADMFNEQYWAHTSPSGHTPWYWVKSTGYSYDYAGENLAKGFISSQGVITAWLNSAEHRTNLLDNRYLDVGFAVEKGMLNGEETTLVVALYGAPSQQTGSVAALGEVLAADTSILSPVARIGVALQSMTPAMLGSLLLMVLAAIVALGAHAYRQRLPKALRQSWYRHHGLFKAAGMSILIVTVIALYGGGQI